MRLDRRTMLKGAGLAGAAVAVPVMAAPITRLVVFDSRIAESVAFARTQTGFARIDIADQDATQWRAVRDLGAQARIEGLTRWSDWVALRGELQARGARQIDERRIAAPLSGRDHLFRWSMAAR
jgi:hypothetical protein